MVTNTLMAERFWLGLPAWAFPGWRGTFFDDKPSALHSYASVFNAVEGNTTFYAIPEARNVSQWLDAVAGRRFRFSFKLPSSVTHRKPGSLRDLHTFLTRLEPLQPYLGPLLVQFPASVGPAELPFLQGILKQLPSHFPRVVEVRHRSFFENGDSLGEVLDRHSAGRVVHDTRALYRGDQAHPDVQAAVHEKPDLPVLKRVHNGVAFVRLMLHPDGGDINQALLMHWARRVAEWLQVGHHVSMMIHCPNNQFCPMFAATFNELLRKEVMAATGSTIPALSDWPIPQQHSLW